MSFEKLPNEIILDLFEYFDGSNLLRAFYGLNSRLNSLLYNQFQSYYFNFNLISKKRDFDIICQRHFPYIANRILKMHLSDNAYAPKQISLFLSYMSSSFNQLSQLRSLSIGYIGSYTLLMNVIDHCQHLPNLTHLYFYHIHSAGYLEHPNYKLIINNIWNLPKLIYCKYYILYGDYVHCYIPQIISSSIKSLYLYSTEFSLDTIHRIFQYTPCLQHLRIHVSEASEDYKPSPFFSLTSLDIVFKYVSASIITSFLENLPNLRCLDIQLSVPHTYELIDGNAWNYGIRNYLPKLKVFRLVMDAPFFNAENKEQEINELLDSFRSSFWLDEHQWFVGCSASKKNICLETLSTRYKNNLDSSFEFFKTTCPQDNIQIYYNDKATLNDRIWIYLPIDDQFWSTVERFDQVKSLYVYDYNDCFQSQLQTIFNRIPSCLDTLEIRQDQSLPLQRSLFECTKNITAYELDLYMSNPWWGNPLYVGFNKQDCIALCRSSLSTECKILHITVENRENILYLVNNMPKLEILNVVCKDDKYQDELELWYYTSSQETRPIIDELIDWLKYRLSSAHIMRTTLTDNIIGMWL
ncbi:unnamed protein product [Rotaria sordida]|uniref:F-box domain-containing protein n=1 Tax=Rotaria sordida TaxID=392033 RepID=A0A815ISX7_9BILA|nr:unnamed protein product [Rotaria sordida]